MKPIRTLLFLFYSLASFWAQAQQGTQTFVLVPATGFTGTPYQVTFTRPENDYPLGSVNLAKRALIDGAFNLRVISSGTYSGTTYTPNKFYASCYIAKGTKPGVNPPSCAFTTVITPPTTTTTVITIPAVNQTFAAADGSGTGSDIGAGYYGPYTDNSQYRQFSYSAPVTASNYNLAIHYKTNTQTTGKGNIVVNGSTNVEFDLEGAEGGTRTTYRTIPLNVGSNSIRLEGKSGTTYFFDNLFLTRAASTTTASTTTTTPPTQTTTTTPPTSGSVDAQGFIVYEDQGWSGSDVKRIENSEMFLEFKKSVGACVTGAGLKSNNRNVVNDEQVRPNGGPQISDKGVQWQVSPYAWPSGNQPLTIGQDTRGGTGVNPVQGGSANPYFQPGVVEKSAIIQTADRGVVFCARGRGLLWDWFSVPGNMPYDIEWWFLPGNVITYKVRLTIEPWPSSWSGVKRYQSLSNELMCLYNIGAFNNHIVRINGSEVNLRDGVPLDGQSNDFFTSECWAATYQPDRSQGVLYYTPRNSIFKSWQKRGESGEWPDPSMSYINAGVKRTYDIAGTSTIDNGYIILGSQSQAMARLQTLEPIDQTYDFDFTSLNNQWWNEDARVMRNGNGSLRYYCGDEKTDNGQTNTFGRFLSPCRAWQASQFANVEFDMAVSGVNSFYLTWGKPGRFGQYEYKQLITVNGDGTRRTYQFNLSNLPNWNGTITYLGLQAVEPGKPAAFVDMYRARKFSMSGFGEIVLISLATGGLLRRRKVLPALMLRPTTDRKQIRIA